jgi:hypothetical protein
MMVSLTLDFSPLEYLKIRHRIFEIVGKTIITILKLNTKAESANISAFDTCYISPVLTTLDTVRYTKHTCTLVRFQIMASYMYP